MQTAAAFYLIVVLVMSLICLLTYGFDKRRAAAGGRRVPERTLHMMAFLGGWPGAWLGQRQFRHKTQKTRFIVVFRVLVVLHIAIVVAAAYLLAKALHA